MSDDRGSNGARGDGGDAPGHERPDRATPDPEVTDGVVRDDVVGGPGSTRLRRRRMTGWSAGALVVLLVVLGAVYYKVTDDAADQVVLRWRQSPPHCGDAKVRPAADETFGSFTPAAVVVTEGFRCTVVVEVLNNSERPIRLDHAVAQGVGPETGSVVRADPRSHPQRGHAADISPERFRLDAYVEVEASGGLDLDAGQSTTFPVHLVFNPDGCVMGATMWVDGWPEVSFSVLGREFARPTANTLALFHRGRTPGCRHLNND